MEIEDKKLEIATFRFGVISEFVTGVQLDYGEKRRILREKSQRKYQIPFSTNTSVSISAIQKWIVAYRSAGHRIEGLMPKPREDKGTYRKLDATVRLAIKDIKREKPHLTVPVVVKFLRQNKIIQMDEEISNSCIYRYLQRERLNKPNTDAIDKRAFEASFSNELWQSDVMHGPYVLINGINRKTYLCTIIDDYSRLVISGKFFQHENLTMFKKCLQFAIKTRGIPHKLYVDNGACFRALNLEQITACMGIGLKHSRPYTPQGRGKIERFFRTVRDSFLPLLPNKLSLNDINEKFYDWVEEYNDKVHSSTKSKPKDRYRKNMECIRPAPKDLMNYFRMIDFRKVKKDRTFQLRGCRFEAPVELIDRKVELKYHDDSPNNIEIFFENQSFGSANLLDLNVNALGGRNYKPLPTKQIEVLKTSQKIEDGKLFGVDNDQ